MIDFCLVGGGFIGPLHAANIAAIRTRGCAGSSTSTPRRPKRSLPSTAGGRRRISTRRSPIRTCGAVMICTPPRTHAAIIERAARAGKAVFCEKPIDLDMSRVDACGHVLEATRTPFFVGIQPALRSVASRTVRRDSRR